MCDSHYNYSNLQKSGVATLNRDAWNPFYLMGNFCVPPLNKQTFVYRSGPESYNPKLVEGYCGGNCGKGANYALGGTAWGNYYRLFPSQPTAP